jgi:hypothetical protein
MRQRRFLFVVFWVLATCRLGKWLLIKQREGITSAWTDGPVNSNTLRSELTCYVLQSAFRSEPNFWALRVTWAISSSTAHLRSPTSLVFVQYRLNFWLQVYISVFPIAKCYRIQSGLFKLWYSLQQIHLSVCVIKHHIVKMYWEEEVGPAPP